MISFALETQWVPYKSIATNKYLGMCLCQQPGADHFVVKTGKEHPISVDRRRILLQPVEAATLPLCPYHVL